ncbi:hypothetical protein BGZ82_000450 [Podila clonocystis]|nr:hypothetical protein BGZ82_000450 [Podila clonocystis]
MAMQLKSDVVMVINYRKGPVGTHIPLQTQFPASVPYRLTMSSDTFSSLMTRISGLAKQFPHPVQMQRDSSLYLYVESFRKSHSDPKDHYIKLTAENYQAALTQDWLRQYQQCLSKPEFSNDKTDNFIKLQLFIFIEDFTPPVTKHMKTYTQPPVQVTAPQAPIPARATAPTQPTVQTPVRASVAQKATTSFNANRFTPVPHTDKNRPFTADVPQVREGVYLGTPYQPLTTQHVQRYLVSHLGTPTPTTTQQAPSAAYPHTPATRAALAQQTPHLAGNFNPSAAALKEAGALLDRAIGHCIIPNLGESARSYMLTQVTLRPSMSLTDLSTLVGTLDVKILIAHDRVMAVMERWGGMDPRERGEQRQFLEELKRSSEKLERLKEQQQQRLTTIQHVQQRLQLKHQPQQYLQQREQFLEEAQLEEERQREEKQRQEEKRRQEGEEQRQRQLQQNKLRKKQEQERARQKTQEALVTAHFEFRLVQEEMELLHKENERRREERRQQNLFRQQQQQQKQQRQPQTQPTQQQCQCPKHRRQRHQQQQQQSSEAVRGGEAHGGIEQHKQTLPTPAPKIRQNMDQQQPPEKLVFTKPTATEQIIVARIVKQNAQEGAKAADLAVKKAETPEPRKPLTRLAVQQQREEEKSRGNVSGAQSSQHDQKPKRSARRQETADAKDTQVTPTTATTTPQEGYRTVTVNINGVDMPVAIEVESLRAALDLTSVKGIQPLKQEQSEGKNRAPAEPIRRSKRLRS